MATSEYAYKKRRPTGLVSAGMALQFLGLLVWGFLTLAVPFFGWFIGAFVGIPMFVKGYRLSRPITCSRCAHRLPADDVAICSGCGAEFIGMVP